MRYRLYFNIDTLYPCISLPLSVLNVHSYIRLCITNLLFLFYKFIQFSKTAHLPYCAQADNTLKLHVYTQRTSTNGFTRLKYNYINNVWVYRGFIYMYIYHSSFTFNPRFVETLLNDSKPFKRIQTDENEPKAMKWYQSNDMRLRQLIEPRVLNWIKKLLNGGTICFLFFQSKSPWKKACFHNCSPFWNTKSPGLVETSKHALKTLKFWKMKTSQKS